MPIRAGKSPHFRKKYFVLSHLNPRVHKTKSVQRLLSSLLGTGTTKLQVTWLYVLYKRVYRCASTCLADRWLAGQGHTQRHFWRSSQNPAGVWGALLAGGLIVLQGEKSGLWSSSPRHSAFSNTNCAHRLAPKWSCPDHAWAALSRLDYCSNSHPRSSYTILRTLGRSDACMKVEWSSDAMKHSDTAGIDRSRTC